MSFLCIAGGSVRQQNMPVQQKSHSERTSSYKNNVIERNINKTTTLIFFKNSLGRNGEGISLEFLSRLLLIRRGSWYCSAVTRKSDDLGGHWFKCPSSSYSLNLSLSSICNPLHQAGSLSCSCSLTPVSSHSSLAGTVERAWGQEQ